MRPAAEGERLRLFFALWPDAAWAARLQSAVVPWLADSRTVAAADLHVTLRFLGDVSTDRLSSLCERAAGVVAAPVELRFDRLEHWRGARALVAAADTTPAAAALAEALAPIAQALQLAADPRPFRPHITLARGMRVAPAALPRLAQPWVLHASAFSLACGVCGSAVTNAPAARYRLLASWPLSVPPPPTPGPGIFGEVRSF